jgi:hypothetical protein
VRVLVHLNGSRPIDCKGQGRDEADTHWALDVCTHLAPRPPMWAKLGF